MAGFISNVKPDYVDTLIFLYVNIDEDAGLSLSYEDVCHYLHIDV